MEEFEMVSDAVSNGEVRFVVSLGQPDIKLQVSPGEEGDLFADEELTLKLAKSLQGIDELRLRKRMAAMLIQGSATLKMYMFHLVEKELKEINPKLINLYGIVSTMAQIGYWVTPSGIEEMAAEGGAEGGAEEVVPEGDTYVIRAQGLCFPFLVHEIVKGIYDWISINPEFTDLASSGIEAETKDIIVGPEIFKVLQKSVPNQKLLPLVQKYFLELSSKEMKEILSGSSAGKDILSSIISMAEENWEEYQSSKEGE